jgi:hypothetical protein
MLPPRILRNLNGCRDVIRQLLDLGAIEKIVQRCGDLRMNVIARSGDRACATRTTGSQTQFRFLVAIANVGRVSRCGVARRRSLLRYSRIQRDRRNGTLDNCKSIERFLGRGEILQSSIASITRLALGRFRSQMCSETSSLGRGESVLRRHELFDSAELLGRARLGNDARVQLRNCGLMRVDLFLRCCDLIERRLDLPRLCQRRLCASTFFTLCACQR